MRPIPPIGLGIDKAADSRMQSLSKMRAERGHCDHWVCTRSP